MTEDIEQKKTTTEVTPQEPKHIQEEEEEQDVDMTGDEEQEEEPDREKIKLLTQATSEDGTSASFQIVEEDHTLGNALRYVIMKNPDVEFCGYSIPHPSENLLNIRIQTYGETTAVDALQKGLKDLMDLCDVVESKFTEKIKSM
ncbi:XXYS1_4_G0013640.mRNA.1.CDS.1 [Saccharomyces cerevisiae]|nr:EM14S01-3B_G0010980.mRNA.1.CDS.1 [Saccharomyces cerevisiae]CAD6644165.1 XXYS1_4_G0013640.mRNA.1.CDS.1 [Saccharomyces cerevisiae]CAI4733896.1 CEI_1a_G0045370.mRNA.1.CDS.1 [Saccharomyces cerevisiae]CAI4737558.1 AMH_1a_G0045480.mRNA.1.CDS.1 [Saccharomyces cerevisiae]CAI6860035.1 AMH_1a_G0045480.mRNA.1.CDS.1 [Saccharomyces cerevisiae]